MTIIDSDDEAEEDDRKAISSLEKTVVRPILSALKTLENGTSRANSKNGPLGLLKTAIGKVKGGLDGVHAQDKWAKGTGFGGSTTTTIQKTLTKAEVDAEKEKVRRFMPP
jgi:hypothetical protein